MSQEPQVRKRRQPSWRAPALVAACAAIALTVLGVLIGMAVRSGTASPSAGPAKGAAATAPPQPGSPPECKLAVGEANRTLDQAVRVEGALAEHTKIMQDLDAGRITAQQAFAMGQPSLTRGAAESAKFDQALSNYWQVAAKCS